VPGKQPPVHEVVLIEHGVTDPPPIGTVYPYAALTHVVLDEQFKQPYGQK